MKVFNKYANFVNIFLPKLAAKLVEYKNINNYAIQLMNYLDSHMTLFIV